VGVGSPTGGENYVSVTHWEEKRKRGHKEGGNTKKAGDGYRREGGGKQKARV